MLKNNCNASSPILNLFHAWPLILEYYFYIIHYLCLLNYLSHSGMKAQLSSEGIKINYTSRG